METTVTNQNCIHKEFRSKMKSANAGYDLAQNVLSSCLLPKDIKYMYIQNYNVTCSFVGLKCGLSH
jgi:hypothetical protein